jgi:hypothetical protein
MALTRRTCCADPALQSYIDTHRAGNEGFLANQLLAGNPSFPENLTRPPLEAEVEAEVLFYIGSILVVFNCVQAIVLKSVCPGLK